MKYSATNVLVKWKLSITIFSALTGTAVCIRQSTAVQIHMVIINNVISNKQKEDSLQLIKIVVHVNSVDSCR